MCGLVGKCSVLSCMPFLVLVAGLPGVVSCSIDIIHCV